MRELHPVVMFREVLYSASGMYDRIRSVVERDFQKGPGESCSLSCQAFHPLDSRGATSHRLENMCPEDVMMGLVDHLECVLIMDDAEVSTREQAFESVLSSMAARGLFSSSLVPELLEAIFRRDELGP